MKFGQYELLELIAVGGMAEVFKGRVVAAEGFEKLVAIKRILPDLAEDERFVKMLLTEARIHSALSHRNIVQIHDLGISEDGQYFIVLEYVEGYDLRMITEQLAAEGEIIPEVLSLHIASELAQGLHFAHELKGDDGQPLGLIHRDVTPSNVLISMAGEVKLSDFGLAKRRHDRSVVGSLKGSLSYMSPEQAMQLALDRRTDIFSLGAVLFELLTGRRLREITDEVAGWSHVASGAVPSVRTLRPDLPPAVERLLDRALAADPNQRFPDAGAFGTAIRQALGEMNIPVGASDLGALLGVVNPPRRPRSLMMERSKVIRLGPEARALREAFAAPPTPAPIRRTPRAEPETPQVDTSLRKTQFGRGDSSAARPAASALAQAARPAPAPADPDATPPPTTALPPTRPRTGTPRPPGDGRVRRPSNPPNPVSNSRSNSRSNPPSNPPLTARGPVAPLRTGSGQYPAAVPQRPSPVGGSGRVGARARDGFGSGPQGRAQPFPGTPGHGVPRPQLANQARRVGTAPFGMPAAAGLPTFAPGRPQRETARVQQLRPRRRWRSALLFLIVIGGGGGAAVNRWVVPLDVLLVWRNPADLTIATDPSGATLRLDGVTLPATSPTTVSVRRDLLDHVVEATRAGCYPARATVRYDKTLTLSFLMPLLAQPIPPPVMGPSPAPGQTPPAPAKTRAAP
ncbi:MAG TPA: protein kinase [Polyangia bacterium]|jgi:serine/threonine-protein kinase|nr:protein kinase [Polyangia bacterium]